MPELRADRWVLFATILGSSLVFIDGSIVALALPAIQREFHASAAAIQWIVEAYTLVLGALMLFGGALGDRAGRRRIFMTGIVLFALGSLACSVSQSIGMLIAARVLQGIGGMLLAPASLALIGSHFSGEQRDRAFASWSAYGALVSSIGPAVGGLIIDHFGWRIVFLLNIPLSALVMWATIRCVAESRNQNVTGPLDISGTASATLGLGAITYALITSTTHGWLTWQTGGGVVFGFIMLAVFILIEKYAGAPIMPLNLFRSSSFSGVNAMTLFLYGALGANFYFLPFAMIQGHGYSATAAAIATLPVVVFMVGLARVGTWLMRRIGRRPVLTFGPAIAAVGFTLLGSFDSAASYWIAFFPGLTVIGIGLGFTVAPLTATAIDSADPEHIGSASGINNAIARTAGLLAIAALGVVLWTSFNAQLDRRLNAAHVTPSIRAQVNAQRSKVGGAHVGNADAQAVILRAFQDGYSAVAYASALLAVSAGILAFATIRFTELHDAR